MKVKNDVLYFPYKTTEVGKKIIESLCDVMTDYVYDVYEFCQKNKQDMLKLTDASLEKLLSDYLKPMTHTSKEWVKECFIDSVKFYLTTPTFIKNLPRLIENKEKLYTLKIPTNKYGLSKGKPCYFIFSDIHLALHCDVDLKNKSIEKIQLNLLSESLILEVSNNN